MISTIRRRRARLETVRRRLDRWRQKRPHARAPLPPRLWAAAVALVSEHGLYGTARALHLDYGALKQHGQATDGQMRGRVPARFLELPMSPAPTGNAWPIEIAGAHATVRLRLNGLALTDLAEFSRRVVGTGS